MEETQEQLNNSKPWLYKKGQSGNPGGRPVGSKSLKTWLKERFESMTDEERESFFEGMNKIDLFKMAEGNPQSDVTSKGESIVPEERKSELDLDAIALEVAKRIEDNDRATETTG